MKLRQADLPCTCPQETGDGNVTVYNTPFIRKVQDSKSVFLELFGGYTANFLSITT